MNNSKQRKLGAILSYGSILVNTLITLLYTPFLIRMLGQSEYGLYSLVSSIIGYLTILDLGFGNALIVYTAKYREQKKYEEEKKLHGMFFVIFCIIGVIASIIGLILFFNVENLFGSTMSSIEIKKAKIMMLILTFNLAITFPFSVFSSIISAYEKFVFQKLISLVQSILKPIIMIPLLLLSFKSISMVVVITLLNIFVFISNYLYCKNKLDVRIKFMGFDKVIFKTILNYSIFIFIGVIVEKVNYSLDQFILGTVSGTIAVSLYSVAGQLNHLFRNISSCCCSIMLPKLSKMVSRNCSDSELSKEFIKFGRIQWYIMFLIVSGFIILGKEFMKIWAGVEFETSYYIALLLIVPSAFVLVENIGVYIMQAKNLHKIKAIITLIAAILNVIISIPLAKYYGGIGSALGTCLSLIICNLIIINIYYQKVVKIDALGFWKNIFKISIPLVIVFLLGYIINFYFIQASSLIVIMIFAVIYALIYFVVSYFISFNAYEKSLINGIIKKIKSRCL